MENSNTKKNIQFITLGCKVNQYETNAMAQKFIEKNYNVIEENNKEKNPDICIINTCIFWIKNTIMNTFFGIFIFYFHDRIFTF